jgi:hypothetical protein
MIVMEGSYILILKDQVALICASGPMCYWLTYIKPSICSPIPTLFRGSEFNCRVLMKKSPLGHQRRKNNYVYVSFHDI